MKEIISQRMILIVMAAVILAASFFAAYYFYNQYSKTKALLQNVTQNPKDEIGKVISEVGKLIALPQNEVPQLATVTDVTKLKSQPFFANAQNGDKVLIYAQAKEAILYRPSLNKIIQVSNINLATSSTNVTPSVNLSPTPSTVSVTVYNGTKTAGLALVTEAKITTAFPNVKVIKTGNSVADYTKTEIIDLTGKNKDLAQQIANYLGGTVVNFPSGEVRPISDILIIIGK